MLFPSDLLAAFTHAQAITVLTGAGVSAESGIPTFRDAQKGLWSQYRPEELATREAFARDPQRVWEWYAYRRRLVAEAQPNPGHFALANLEAMTTRFALITQNIDGLHQAAGSHHVLELHGSIWKAKCFDCEVPYDGSLDVPNPPICSQCGALVRPNVTWFGEPLPGKTLQAAAEAAQTAGIFLLIGTSALVQPAASLPMLAVEHGERCIEINPEDTPLSPWMTDKLRGKSGDILPALISAIYPNTRE